MAWSLLSLGRAAATPYPAACRAVHPRIPWTMIVRHEPGRESAAAMWSMRSSAMSRSLLPEAPQTTTLPGAITAPGSVGEK